MHQKSDVETQLFYCKSRYYLPELCRFISPDSIEYLDPESINGCNLYAYCGNDPVRGYDPSGNWNWGKFLLIAGISVAAVATAYFTGGSSLIIAATAITGIVASTSAGLEEAMVVDFSLTSPQKGDFKVKNGMSLIIDFETMSSELYFHTGLLYGGSPGLSYSTGLVSNYSGKGSYGKDFANFGASQGNYGFDFCYDPTTNFEDACKAYSFTFSSGSNPSPSAYIGYDYYYTFNDLISLLGWKK